MGRALCARQLIARQLVLRVARGARFFLPDLHRIPQCLVDDAQLWLIIDDPLRFGVAARAARKAAIVIGYLDPDPTVEDTAPDINLVVEDALAEARVARQSRRVPDACVVFSTLSSARGGDAIPVQARADLLQALSLGIKVEDALYQLGLRLVDRKPVNVAPACVLSGDLTSVTQNFPAGHAAAARLAL
ncbi:hypothetical protein QN347_19170 [Sphingomonas sp. 10B4]|nr:hypothetical protein [Sphingomonas sp. 10B4]MEB0284600.1 hypothetical protein [Sphingomonas sp. 10B4]